jgi:hypothetical protein
MRGPQRSLKVESRRSQAEAALPYGEFLLRVPGDTADVIRAIAKYEERHLSTVVRSLVLLGLRVYRALDEGISPFGPAHVNVTDEEVQEAASAIRVAAKERHAWQQRINLAS